MQIGFVLRMCIHYLRLSTGGVLNLSPQLNFPSEFILTQVTERNNYTRNFETKNSCSVYTFILEASRLVIKNEFKTSFWTI